MYISTKQYIGIAVCLRHVMGYFFCYVAPSQLSVCQKLEYITKYPQPKKVQSCSCQVRGFVQVEKQNSHKKAYNCSLCNLFLLTLTYCSGQIWPIFTFDSCKNTPKVFYPKIWRCFLKWPKMHKHEDILKCYTFV